MIADPKIEVKDNQLIITCDVSGEGEMSSSGRTRTISSTFGFIDVGQDDLIVNVNVNRRIKRRRN